MTFPRFKSRVLLWIAFGSGVLALVLVAARLSLMQLAVAALLQWGGASEVTFQVTHASPWRVVVEDVAFQVRTQPFGARRVMMERAHWWTPSLGAVTVEQARVPWVIDGSDLNPSAWATYKNGTPTLEPLSVPLDKFSLDGQLIIQAAALPEQALTVKLTAETTSAGNWAAQVRADGPGFALEGSGDFAQGTNTLEFKIPRVALDLKIWQDFVQRLVVLPGEAWELEGQISGRAAGRQVGKKLTATGVVQVREGRMRYPAKEITATGIEADVSFTDLTRLLSQPGTLRVSELRAGRLTMHDIRGGFTLAEGGKVAVSEASLQALGGRVAVEPFHYFFDQREVEAVVLAEGIQIAEVMALTQDLPAQATGRVNGRLPLRIDEGGLRLGTGWLALMPGVTAEIQFNARGLLTDGVSPKHPGFPMLQKIEAGLLKLKIGEMRLDIRPPDAPAGRTAQLHIKGQPVDPEVKAPVVLDLNVNGPLERLLNLGLDSRVSIRP